VFGTQALLLALGFKTNKLGEKPAAATVDDSVATAVLRVSLLSVFMQGWPQPLLGC